MLYFSLYITVFIFPKVVVISGDRFCTVSSLLADHSSHKNSEQWKNTNKTQYFLLVLLYVLQKKIKIIIKIIIIIYTYTIYTQV